MAQNFGGAAYHHSSSTPATDEPMTLAVWYKPSVANEPTVRVPISICNTSARNAWLLYGSNANLFAWQAAGASDGQSGQNPPLTTDNQHCLGVFAANASRTGYYNGTAAAANTTSLATSGVNLVVIGAWNNGGAYAGQVNANISEAAIWSVALTAAEITSLAKGFSPRRIRPQSLEFYCPLIRNTQDLRKGITFTTVGTPTAAVHPRVY